MASPKFSDPKMVERANYHLTDVLIMELGFSIEEANMLGPRLTAYLIDQVREKAHKVKGKKTE